jgi:hypothetical protein
VGGTYVDTITFTSGVAQNTTVVGSTGADVLILQGQTNTLSINDSDGISVTGGTGVDTITFTTAVTATTVLGGSGADVITFAGNSAANTASVTGGTGVDTIDFGGGTHTGGIKFTLTAEAAAPTSDATIDAIITNFIKGTDKIAATNLIVGTQTATAGPGVATITGGVATFNAADTTLAQHFAAVAAALQATAGATAIWTEGSDSYVYVSDGTLANAATDYAVKLVGITAGALTVSSNVITGIA